MSAEAASPRLIVLWIAMATLIFAVALWLAARGDNGVGMDPIGPSTDSRSALGYAGIADILDQIGTPVIRSRSRSRDRLGDGGVLVIAEPRVTPQNEAAVRKLIDARTVLLILPKWEGAASATRPGWIERAEIAPDLAPDLAFELTGVVGEAYRGPPPTAWDRNLVGPKPAVAGIFQFVRSKKLKPIVASGDRILVGEVRRKDGRRIWVLADPDVIDNVGLSNPGNAAFAVALIGKMRQGEGPVVFDEAIHGVAGTTPSLIGLLFHFPMVTATLGAMVATGLLLWAAMPRFGAPAEPEPALESGKIGLIANTAALLSRPGDRRLMLRRFAEVTMQEVAARLHAPRGLSPPALGEWLARAGRARGVAVDGLVMLDMATAMAESGPSAPGQLARLAQDITRWKREMIDGPAGDQTTDRRAARRGAQGDRRAG
jgi:hypothetical protein